EVTAHDPSTIFRLHVDPQLGLLPFQGRTVARGLKLKGDTARKCGKLVASLIKAYLDTDASLVEINPLLITGDSDVLTLDAKMNFDDNAMFRRADILAMRDIEE